jgi:hypothetical protein
MSLAVSPTGIRILVTNDIELTRLWALMRWLRAAAGSPTAPSSQFVNLRLQIVPLVQVLLIIGRPFSGLLFSRSANRFNLLAASRSLMHCSSQGQELKIIYSRQCILVLKLEKRKVRRG